MTNRPSRRWNVLRRFAGVSVAVRLGLNLIRLNEEEILRHAAR